MKKYSKILCVGVISLTLFTCSKKDAIEYVFPVSDDIKLGAQVETQLAADPATYPLLDKAKYPAAYENLQRITENILNSGKLQYKDKMAWKIYIIQKDDVLNAFCTPGGYIYVYTGIIKYLDTEDQLAGVMGHEIAHADQRHYINQTIKNGATQMLVNAVLGDKSSITQMVSGFLGFAYSRADETDADAKSVEYLSGTTNPKYACNSAGAFFQKMVDGGKADCNALTGLFQTHPCPEKRVEKINTKATTMGCSTTPSGSTKYAEFKSSLP